MADFSSKQFSWCDISIAWGGRILEGVTEIEYSKKKEKDYLYGRGCDPHDIVHGNNTYEGKVKVWQSELEAMTRDAKDKDILNERFNITITYVPKDGGQTVIDILDSVEFTETVKGMKQGDKNMEVELPIMFLKLKPQQ